MTKFLRCFTDGAAKGNSQNSPAGYGFFIPKLNIKQSGALYGSNNVAELTAVKKLFEFIKFNLNNYEQGEKRFEVIMVLTDSKYVIGAMGSNVAKANIELIESIKQLRADLLYMKIKSVFNHVPAHTGGTDFISQCNAIVDKLATDAAKTLVKPKAVVKPAPVAKPATKPAPKPKAKRS